MKVILLRGCKIYHEKGDVLELPAAEAQRLIDLRCASAAAEEKPKKGKKEV